MKLSWLLPFVIFLLAACSSFDTKVSVSEVYPPIVDDNAMIIYSNNQKLPDSSKYVGEVVTKYNPLGWSAGSSKEMLNSLESEIKSIGANAIKMDKNIDDEDRYILVKGKLYRIPDFENVNLDLNGIKKSIEADNDEFEGIYNIELNNDGKYAGKFLNYACIRRSDGNYALVYIDGYEILDKPVLGVWDMPRIWKTGDVYAYLYKTQNHNIFKTEIYTMNKSLHTDVITKFERGYIRIHYSSGFSTFRKVFPDTAKYEDMIGSLTGFQVGDRRILTCHHGVVEPEYKIFIKGINNDFQNRHEAVVEKIDKINDLAILKLVDTTLSFEANNVSVTLEEKSTGDDVYVLGYPMSIIMGEEIKLTNGIISSKSGIAGDVSVYQISAPVQAGNSGAPIIDKNGNLIGMVNSKLGSGDNVAYGIKLNLITDFMNNNGYKNNFTKNDISQNQSLSDKIKAIKKNIYIIEVIDTKEKEKAKIITPVKTRERNPLNLR